VATWSDFAAPVNAVRFGEDLVVAELGTGSVIRQSPEGSRTVIAEGLQAPTGLVASGDDLWVSDWATGTVWQIVTDGEPSMTEAASDLANPEGIAIEEDGSLLVVESGSGRLTRILPSGEPVTLADGLPIGIPAPAGAPPAYVLNGVTIGESGSIYLTGDKASVVWKLAEDPAA
jgi:glucose/arabinose dehydrogenase